MHHRGTENRRHHTLKTIHICGNSSTSSVQAGVTWREPAQNIFPLFLATLTQPFERQQQREKRGFL